MATFNSQTALAAWKKIEYKNGIVKATFMDGDGHLITVAGGEIPHPDFRVKFAQLKYFIDAMLETTPNVTEATSIAYPEPGKVQLTAKIMTNYVNFEVKTATLTTATFKNGNGRMRMARTNSSNFSPNT